MATKITVMKANLFALAATYYGDATQWIIIAQANGLTDPFVEGPVTLVIQDETTPTGGVPVQ